MLIGAITGAGVVLIVYFILERVFKCKNRRVISIISAMAVVASTMLLNNFFMPRYEEFSEMKLVESTSLFKLMSKKDPAYYASFIHNIKKISAGSRNQNLAALYVSKGIRTYLGKYVAFASDASVINLLRLNIKQYDRLLKTQPKIILQLEYPKKFGLADYSKFVSPSVSFRMQLKENTDLETAAIMSAINDPQSPPDIEEISKGISMVFAMLEKEYGKKIVQPFLSGDIPRDVDQALYARVFISFYKDILSLGDKEAAAVVKYIYAEDKSVFKNCIGLQKYIKKAKNNDKSAQHDVGLLYFKGICVKKDLNTAFYWFEKSAFQGQPDAQFAVMMMYYYGEGVSQDLVRAYVWLKIYSAHVKSKQIKKAVPVLFNKLNKEQQIQAEALLRKYRQRGL